MIFLPLVGAAFLLYPTYEAGQLQEIKDRYDSKIEKAAKSGDQDKALSLTNEFSDKYGEDYNNARNKRLKLGLDLQGGIYVTLEVDVIKLIEESAVREAKDDIFEKVIESTREEAKNSDEDVLQIFSRKFDEIARPKGKSFISYFNIDDIRDASDEKIKEKLASNANDAIDQALQVLRQRVDKYGVSEPNIQKQGARRILLELPGVKDENEVRKLLQTTARLEFKLVRNNETIIKAFKKIDDVLKQQYLRKQGKAVEEVAAVETPSSATIAESSSTISDSIPGDSNAVAAKSDSAKNADSLNPYAGLKEDEAFKQYKIDHQFTSLFVTQFLPGENKNPVVWQYITDNPPTGEYRFLIPKDSLAKFDMMLTKSEIKSIIPFEYEIVREANVNSYYKSSGVEMYEFFSLKSEPELTGDVITDAYVSFDPTTNVPEVIMMMNSDGADRWSKITGANLKKRISIVLDGSVYSAPTVQVKINNGISSITGSSNVEEANLLQIVLKAGALKAPVQIIEERVIGPSLGEDSISSGINASLFAVLLVIFYMILYYRMGGVIADFAVIMNVTLIIAVLTGFQGTLTLPGIAGIILTIGMAVDANVLIFERIREELYKGRSLRSAIDEGFSKALSAILDSNITTFITGLILFYFGSGPIQGFALTIMIGIGGTLFTGIMVTRAIIEIFMVRGASSFSFGQPKVING